MTFSSPVSSIWVFSSSYPKKVFVGFDMSFSSSFLICPHYLHCSAFSQQPHLPPAFTAHLNFTLHSLYNYNPKLYDQKKTFLFFDSEPKFRLGYECTYEPGRRGVGAIRAIRDNSLLGASHPYNNPLMCNGHYHNPHGVYFTIK